MIKKLALKGKKTEGIINIRRFHSLNLYVLTSNSEIHESVNNELLYFYEEYYTKNFKSFEEFLDAVLNKEFILDKSKFENPDLLNSFKLNSKITKEYSNLGFHKFLKKHSKQLDKNSLILNNSNIKKDEYLTIIYLFYKNGYDISSDCYLGVDYIRKREDVIK